MSLRLNDLIEYKKEKKDIGFLQGKLFWYTRNQGWKWILGQNFGDYLSNIVVSIIAKRKGYVGFSDNSGKRLFAIGSILHYANDGDVVWGSGINGKINICEHKFTDLSVRMVRGHLTKKFLEGKGIFVPDVFGDPALLLPYFLEDVKIRAIPGKVIMIPNLNELKYVYGRVQSGIDIISPFMHWRLLLNEILSSELVLSSSLHGIILSEAFSVPVRFIIPSREETIHKYHDYYSGTQRELPDVSDLFHSDIMLDSGISMPAPKYDIQKMLSAFPDDLFC